MAKKKLKLGTRAEEATACIAAWKGKGAGTAAWHCHHEALCEALYLPSNVSSAEGRIAYILHAKPKDEQALRLRLFRPMTDAAKRAWKSYEKASYAAFHKPTATTRKARDAALRKFRDAHRRECPNCPWNGKTIFPTK